jgi:electron transfer flavoprotein alpha subunit
MDRNILVLAEVKGGKLRNVSLEAITAAKQAANNGQVIAAVLGNDDMKGYAETLAQYGADQVYVVSDPRLEPYTTDAYHQVFTQLIEAVHPDAIFMGHTAVGKDLAPRVAARLKLGLISDCVHLSVEGEDILFTRPIYAGKAFEKRKINEGIVFATIRPNNFEIGQPDESRTANTVPFQAEIKDLRTIVKDIVRKASGSIDLTEAKIIVSGGRGVKNENGFKPLYDLAEVLSAAVGASRGACDANYCNYSMQIGQTGKVVTPDLYIACGISGAIQHLAGMSNSRVIVAINKDPEAPIFKVADYGIVGDLFEVVPLLTEEFKKVLAKNL